MYHSFLIHSSADGHLGCFHVLAPPFKIDCSAHGKEAGVRRAPISRGLKSQNYTLWDFTSGPVVKNPPANAGNMGSISGPGRSQMIKSRAWAPQQRSDEKLTHCNEE